MSESQYQPLYQLQASLEATKSQPNLSSSTESIASSTSTPKLLTRILSVPLLAPLSRQSSLREKYDRTDIPVIQLFNWHKIPLPVIERILFHLRVLHLSTTSKSCSICYQRDLISLQLTNKFFFSVVSRHLYSDIKITGSDPISTLKKLKISNGYGGRLTLLRRTLRANPTLASLVQTLQVPDPIIPIYLHNTDHDPNPAYDHYISLLASIIMTCPNLRIFRGFVPFYNHTFDRLSYALSTRPHLTSHTWLITENADISQRATTQLAPGHMDQGQVYEFRTAHAQWSNLDTLLLCSPASAGILEAGVLIDVLHSLPSLCHLCVAGFDADDFTDSTLYALPRLKSLRLDELIGVSDAGLAKWASSPNAMNVEKLTLIHLNIESLLTVAKLLAALEDLKKFTIVQSEIEPILPEDMEDAGVIMQPLFASRTLEWLHWDIVSYPLITSEITSSASASAASLLSMNSTRTSTTTSSQNDYDNFPDDRPNNKISLNSHLALSILHNGFPQLANLRAPRDMNPQGTLQSVCRPMAGGSALIEGDLMMLHTMHDYSSRTDERGIQNKKINSNDLQMARIRAQRIIDEAKIEKKGFFKILVTDHSPCDTSDTNLEQVDTNTSSSDTTSLWSPTITTATDATEPEYQSQLESIELDAMPGQWSRETAGATLKNTKLNESKDNLRNSDKEVVRRDSLQISKVSGRTTPRQSMHIDQESESTPARSSYYASFLFPRSTSGPKVESPVQKIHEYDLPSFIGRISFTLTPQGEFCRPPIFNLKPDIPGHDANGGLVGWAEYLRVAEREKASSAQSNDSKRKPEAPTARKDDDFSDDDHEDDCAADKANGGHCIGAWNRPKINHSTAAETSRPKTREKEGSWLERRNSKNKDNPRSKDKSNLGWRHTRRPRRVRDIRPEDFF